MAIRNPRTIVFREVEFTRPQNPAAKRIRRRLAKISLAALGGVLLLTLSGIVLWLQVITPALDLQVQANALKADMSGMTFSLSSADFASIRSLVTRLQSQLQRVNQPLQQLRWLSDFPGEKENFAVADKLIATSQSVLISTNHLLDAIEPAFGDLSVVTNGTVESGQLSPDSVGIGNFGEHLMSQLDGVQTAITDTQTSFKAAQLQLQDLESQKVMGSLHTALVTFDEKLTKINADLLQAADLFKIVPTLFAKDTQQTYLLVVQNNTELRPAGGFWGNYGLLTIENGKIGALVVHDIYSIDNDPKAYKYGYRAPQPIAKFLSTPYLHLRDANWWPDIPTSSKLISDMFTFESKQKVDGIIYVDPRVIEDLVRLVGPIKVPDYDVTIDSTNVVYQIQYQVEHNITTMSTRKDFVGVLGKIVMDRVYALKGDGLKSVVKLVFDNLDTKHLQLFSNNADVQAYYCARDWCGAIKPTPQDYLMVVDANLGIDKANFFVDKTISYSVNEVNAKLQATLTLNYNNQSTWGWPGGAYTTYLRVYTPKGSQLVKATGYSDTPTTFSELADTPNEKTVFGGVVKVPVKSSQKVTLQYELPFTVSATGGYQLLVQKQAGTPTIPNQPAILGDAFHFDLTAGEATVWTNQSLLALQKQGSRWTMDGVLSQDQLIILQAN